ncbi:DUF4010 domain-containing protein, partial [Candidatus Peregrinibacteria bacterium]|nr:DUF4010 domain-containing protein [Candidatus Peregrinibacteria bacterium]
LFVLVISSYVVTSMKSEIAGATTEVAAIVTFVIGVLCGMEKFLMATSISLFVVVLLQFKDPLHSWVKALSKRELISAIKFVLVAFVVLPILPNEFYGPYDFFNPYIIWLMVVFISGISFLSYVAIKLFGTKKGIGLTGFLSGLISSTALVLSFAPMSKKNKSVVEPYVIAIVIASSAMFFRVLLEVLVLNQTLFNMLLLPMSVMGGVGILVSLYLFFRKDGKSSGKLNSKALDLKSPFTLAPALKFGLFFAVILFFVSYTKANLGDKGVYVTSVISGVLDVDAITVSIANLAKNGLNKDVAVNAISIGAITNTIVKGGIFAIFGGRRAAAKILLIFAAMLFAGILTLLFV